MHTEQAQPYQVKVEYDLSRGRKVKRLVEVFTPPPTIDPSWQKVLSVIRVTRSGVRDGIAFSTLSYYISSLSPFSLISSVASSLCFGIKHRLIYRLLGLGCFLYLEIMALNQLKVLLTILHIIYLLSCLYFLKISLALS